MKVTRLAILAVALLLAISVAASATGRYELTLLNNSQYYPSYNGTIWTSQYQSKSVAIGPVYIQVYDTITEAISYTNMLCIDLNGTINWGTTWTADYVTGMPTTVVNSTAWDRVIYMTQNHQEWRDEGSANDSTALKQQKSAMQVAVWETITDGSSWNIDKSFSMGGFALGNISGDYTGSIRTGIETYAESYYNDALANATAGYGSNYGYYLADDASRQDLMFFVPNYGPPVPEVPTMLLGSLGLTLIGAIKRKIGKG
ncbi:MAG: hypothetical protein ABFD49_01225 [Armatimonadota bacterium]|nr:hypothetical protein [bacterium]